MRFCLGCTCICRAGEHRTSVAGGWHSSCLPSVCAEMQPDGCTPDRRRWAAGPGEAATSTASSLSERERERECGERDGCERVQRTAGQRTAGPAAAVLRHGGRVQAARCCMPHSLHVLQLDRPQCGRALVGACWAVEVPQHFGQGGLACHGQLACNIWAGGEGGRAGVSWVGLWEAPFAAACAANRHRNPHKRCGPSPGGLGQAGGEPLKGPVSRLGAGACKGG